MSQEQNKKFKLPDWVTYGLIGLEIAAMIALVIIAFITMKTAGEGAGSGFIKWLIMNRVWFFMLVVFPLIVLFLFNVYLLIRIINDTSQKEFQALTKEELMEEARRQAREELEKELAKQKESANE